MVSSERPGHGNGNPLLLRLRQSRAADEAEIAALAGLPTETRSVAAGVRLVAAGDRAVRLHVLLEGWACRSELLEDGSRQITAVLLPGDLCDLDHLWLDRADCAVDTLSACTVASLDRATVRALAARNPGVARVLGWLGAVENAMLAERNVSLGRRSARERVAHLFCELFVRLAVTGQARGGRYTLPMIQGDLADALGLSTVHVNRVLQSLRSDGLIALKGRELAILDWPALCSAAEFRPGYLHLGELHGLHVGRGVAARPAVTMPLTEAVGAAADA